jgi:replicative DNA helicase
MIRNLSLTATKWLHEEQLPRDLQHESALIAALILRKDRDRWLGQLTVDDFFEPFHQHLFQALKCLPPGSNLLLHLKHEVHSPGQSVFQAIGNLAFRIDGRYWFGAQPDQLDRYIEIVKRVSHVRRRLLKCYEDLAAALHVSAHYFH